MEGCVIDPVLQVSFYIKNFLKKIIFCIVTSVSSAWRLPAAADASEPFAKFK